MPSDLAPRTSALRIGLLGGTFDPPHIGHLVLGECARLQFGLAKVIFLPAGDPWRKTGSPQSSVLSPQSSSHRLAMIRLAVAGNPHFEVDDREVRRPGPTYTVDTLEELHRELSVLSPQSLVLLVGSDALADMPNWKDPDRIRALATLAVAPNPATDTPGASALGTRYSVLPVDMPPLAINSTVIRARVAAGKPIRYLVPEAVEAYIREHHLYLGVRGQGSGARG